jgi:hypothetical protein
MNAKTSLLPVLVCLVLAGCGTPGGSTSTASQFPESTADGLKRVDKTVASVVYARPGINLAGYTKVMLIPPSIAFRKYWREDVNQAQPMNRVSTGDMEEMIEVGKKLLLEEFTAELKKGGYEIVDHGGPEVLAVGVAISDLDIAAPDPSGTAGFTSRTYTDEGGSATLQVLLYDSVTSQLLVHAYDHKADGDDGYSWRGDRSQFTNRNDARRGFNSWAQMLVNGLNKAKTAVKPTP